MKMNAKKQNKKKKKKGKKKYINFKSEKERLSGDLVTMCCLSYYFWVDIFIQNKFGKFRFNGYL